MYSRFIATVFFLWARERWIVLHLPVMWESETKTRNVWFLECWKNRFGGRWNGWYGIVGIIQLHNMCGSVAWDRSLSLHDMCKIFSRFILGEKIHGRETRNVWFFWNFYDDSRLFGEMSAKNMPWGLDKNRLCVVK